MTALDRLADLSAELALRARASRIELPESFWPLPPEASGLRILWPARYDWPPSERWVAPLLARFKERARVEVVEPDASARRYDGVVAFEVESGGRRSRVIIDYSDYPVVHEDLAREVLVYFKMQFVKSGYSPPGVIPGGFVMGRGDGYDLLSTLRRQRDRQQFRYDVYGRFSLDFAHQTRAAVITALRDQNRFAYEGSGRLQRYPRFLRDIAQAKVCIDVPGNGDFCYRLMDYFGVGACVISPGHANRLHRDLVPGVHIAYAKPDLSDLVDLCDYYVRDANAREEMCRNSREFFDRYMHRDQLGDYYLAEIWSRLTGGAAAVPRMSAAGGT